MINHHNLRPRNDRLANRANSLSMGLIYPLVALLGLYIFSTSFFLAKRSMPHTSTCMEAKSLLKDTLGLSNDEIRKTSIADSSNGCWTERRVDSMVILVVDALRFDFALHHLPLSVGARLQNSTQESQLLKFVADPPTVTMQRLKGLTTGGLPTFADISASFGGATVDEDSWVQQLVDTVPMKRGVKQARMAFVGDDTWVDLFPTQFEDSHPFPSFNTRDLDSVDDGCLEHLPHLLKSLRRDSNPNGFEVIVAHFLGVDHVGHTYGPHNIHMDAKLRQMDAMIGAVLDVMDDKSIKSCHAALVFGDHGMTEGGNHGGGTQDEINAALFAHFSPGCGDMQSLLELTGTEAGVDSERAFQAIRQIDLVPTISILLGLPIPYANIGGLVPSLLPSPNHSTEQSTPNIALSLALNAAQVWRYFTVYSQTANKLPSMPELESLLNSALSAYKRALEHEDVSDSIAYREACGKFKLFLKEAAELGIRVWTRFDAVGMVLGGSILFASALLVAWHLVRLALRLNSTLPGDQRLEVSLASVLMLFYCVLLTFSNSYINAEQNIGTFIQAVICIALCTRLVSAPAYPKNGRIMPAATPWLPLVIPLCHRTGELFVAGHGLDPSIPLHAAHHPGFFLSSLFILLLFRIYLHGKRSVPSIHVYLDVAVLLLVALAWVEKRSSDTARNGYIQCRISLFLLALSISQSVYDVSINGREGANFQRISDRVSILLFRLLAAIMAVTGPSSAASVVLFLVQALVLQRLAEQAGPLEISAPVLAALWRLTVRHAFFSSNHSCAFNRLQYSAAFVATDQFYFVTGGISLFLNTFGWEIVGLVAVSTSAYLTRRPFIWKAYCFYQLLETIGSCISVSLFRRHLMVWAIFAPRFIFAGMFLVLNCVAQVILCIFTR